MLDLVCTAALYMLLLCAWLLVWHTLLLFPRLGKRDEAVAAAEAIQARLGMGVGAQFKRK